MSIRKYKIKKFFKKLWRKIEPFVNELIAYSFVILTFEVGYYLFEVRHHFIGAFYLDDKFRNAIYINKQVVLIGAISLFVFHALTLLFIEFLIRGLKGSSVYIEIKRSRKVEPNSLSPEPQEIDKTDEIKSSKT